MSQSIILLMNLSCIEESIEGKNKKGCIKMDNKEEKIISVIMSVYNENIEFFKEICRFNFIPNI